MNSSELFTVTGLNNVDKPQIQLDSVSQASPFLFSLLQQSCLSQKSGDKSSSLSRRSHYENTAIKRDDTLEISSNSDIIGQRKHNREPSYSKKETDNAVSRMLNKKENELKNQVQILVSCINKAQEQCLQLEKQVDNIRFTEETNSKSYLKQNEKRTIKLAELNQQIELAANKLKFEMILQEQLQQQATLLSENEKHHEIIGNDGLDQSDKENTSYLNKTQLELENEEENGHNNENQLSSISMNTSKSSIDRLKDLMKRSQSNVQNLKQIIAGFQMQQQGISANSMEEADIYQSAETNLQQTLKSISSQLKASNSSRTQLETALVTLLQAHQLNENIVFKAFNIDYESKLQQQKDNFSSEYLECCNSSVISTIRDINSKNFNTLKNYENPQKQKSSEKSSNQQMNPKYGRITIDIKSISTAEPSASMLSSSAFSKQQNNESFSTAKNNYNNFDKENIPTQPNIQVKNTQPYTHTINSKSAQSDNNVSSAQPPSNFIFEKLKQTPNNKSYSSVNHHKNNTNSNTFSSQSNAKYNSNSLSCINQAENSLNCSNNNNNISHVSFFSPAQEKLSKLFFSPSKKEFSSTKTSHHKKQLSNSSLLRINKIAAGTNGSLGSAEKFGNTQAENNLSSKDFSFIWRNKGFRRSRSSSNLQNQNRKRHGSTEQSLNSGTDQRESQQHQANLKIENINFLPIKNNASLNGQQLIGQNNNPLSCHISSCSRRVHSTYSASSQTSSSFQKFQTLNERFTCNTFREYQNDEFVPQVFKQTSHFKQGNHQEEEDSNLKAIGGEDYNQKHTFTLNSQQNQMEIRPLINSSANQKDHYRYPENNQNSFQLNPLSDNHQYASNHQAMLQPVLTCLNPPKNVYLINSNSANVSSNQIDTSGLNLFTNREKSNSRNRLNKTRQQQQLNNQKLFDQVPDTSNVNSRCFEIYKMLGSARENITKKQAYDPRLHLGKPTSFGYTKRIIKINQMNSTLEFIREENSFNSSKRTVEQVFQKALVKEIALPPITESILNLKQRYFNQSVDMENQGIPQRLIDQKYLPFSIEIFRFGKIECVASSEEDLKGILKAIDNLIQNRN